MPLLPLGGALFVLLVLIAGCKLNPFLALIFTSFLLALADGMAPQAALNSILKGMGDTTGSIVLVIVSGAILGKLAEESGAAQSVSIGLNRLFGPRHAQLSMVLTGFCVGLPMFYNAGFLVLTPLVYEVSRTTGRRLLYLGIPVSAALSVTHGFLPPHPAPTAVAAAFHASLNRTLFYGLLLAIPSVLLAGCVLARFFAGARNEPPPHLYVPREFRPEDLPGLKLSVFTLLVPVLLMLGGAVMTSTSPAKGKWVATASFLSDPNIALLLAVVVGLYTLGIRRGRNMDGLMKTVSAAVSSVSMLLLIIASGGGFKQVLLDSGVAAIIPTITARLGLSAILIAWGTAALLRLATGSATVAAITAAGVVLPMVGVGATQPEILVLAVTTGSLMFSHFNDTGFWMFKEYYNASIKQTFQVWTVMECTVGTVGLIGVLLLDAITRHLSP